MQTEKRSAYRVSLSGDDRIQVDVIGESGRVTGDVADLSLKGAAVLFPVADDPRFAIGESVAVQFHTEKADLVEIKATVQTRSELDDTRRFGFAFSDPNALRAKLSLNLLRLFNQRKVFRVEPSESTPVDLQIHVEERELVGRLRNISADGVGVSMDAEAETQLSRVVGVNITLRLPPENEPLTFRASIRNRTRTEAEHEVYYGLQLDPNTPDFSERQRHIVDYVMARQRDLLRSRVGQ